MHQFKTGAVRDELKPRYDLISLESLKRIALVYAEGAEKYGDRNWEQGMPWSDVYNHAIDHLRLYAQGNRGEDHLAKVAWAMFTLMFYEGEHPELDDWTALGRAYQKEAAANPFDEKGQNERRAQAEGAQGEPAR